MASMVLIFEVVIVKIIDHKMMAMDVVKMAK